MKKSQKNMFSIILFLVLVFIITYTYIDNNRINIVQEEVVIDNLPSEFEGFKILQISDLHGKSFGKLQKHLSEKINSIDYDIIAITGDMKDVHSDNIDPFIHLLKNIKNKENIFYVPGNTDLDIFNDEIESNGCKILEDAYKLKRNNECIEIAKFDPVKIYNNNNVRIGLFHYPMTLDDYNKEEYDLILSGHYHGGQIRIPFYGALFIPHINGGKIFPQQDEVSGLKDYGLFKQYTSKGLGSNFYFKLFQFRIFNTPEINVIKLTSAKSN